MLKKIPKTTVGDYALLSTGLFLFFILMRQFGMENGLTDTFWQTHIFLQISGECVIIFLGALISEVIVAYILRMPCDYSKEWPYQIRRQIAFLAILVIQLAATIGQYYTILMWGPERWLYFWTIDGEFTLKWYLGALVRYLAYCLFVSIYWFFLTKSRMKEYRIQELLALNETIDKADCVLEEAETSVINITGDYKESLVVAPSDILFIESVANYLNIWYFNDGELKQKRIRNTLKNVEEILVEYPFLLHCHRAFLVNTQFITHVDGNTAGCQLHLLSIERTIPVSKANIAALRQALH